MKNRLIYSILAVGLLFSTTAVSAQAFSVGTKHLSLGVGFGGYFSYAYFGDFSSTPTIFIAYDQGIIDELGPGNLGVGGFLAYKSSKYDYSYVNYSQTGTWTDFVIGARGTYHWPLDNEKIDLYGALSLGLAFQSYKFESDDPFYDNYDYDANSSFLYYSFSVGGKYMFSEKLGVFAELGYDIAYLKAGVTLGL